MQELQAVKYGEVELIPGIKCDVYILNNDTPVMSERGVAELLGMNNKVLKNMATTRVPKSLKQFFNKDLNMTTTLAMVTAKGSHYNNRKIVVYNSDFIEAIIHAYAMAGGNNVLQKNQLHIGRRCVLLLCALAKTAIDNVIQQACGITPNIQQTVQEQCIKLMKQFGLKASFPEEIYTKKDITNFLDKPASTLNNYLKKHNISYEKIDHETIKAHGGKANRMNGYNLEPISKIILGMDSVVGIELKKQIFGNTGTLVRTDTKGEIE